MSKDSDFKGDGNRPTIRIAVSAHKPYRMPNDSMYLPVHVGAALHPQVLQDMVQDNTGDNISEKNAKYSELTGLYWLWKNNDADYQGIVHYRRHFETAHMVTRLTRRDRFEKIIQTDEMTEKLACADIILPKKRNYYIETIYDHYSNTMHDGRRQLDATGEIIKAGSPEYFKAFVAVMHSKSAHLFNMFVMSREKLNEYCTWLFPILESLENRIDTSTYDAFDMRYPGRVSERLLDVWLLTNGYSYAELPVVSPEPVNWVKKGGSFLIAKFGGQGYSNSF